MKIAFLYSGHIRSFNLTQNKHFELIDKLSKCHDVKLFGHTWDVVESNSQSWWKNESDSIFESEIDIKECLNFINWSGIMIEKEKHFPNNFLNFKSQISYESIYSMFYGWKMVYELYYKYKESKTWVADVLIKLRFDIEFDVEQILKSVDSIMDLIVVNKSQTWGLEHAYSDIIFIGKESIFNPSLALERFESSKTLKLYFKRYKLFIPELFVSKFVFDFSKVICKDLSLIIVRDINIRVQIFDSKLFYSQNFRLENRKFIDGIKVYFFKKIITSFIYKFQK